MNSQLVRRVLLVVVIIAIAVAAIPAFHYYGYLEGHVTTDDAYVDGTVALVLARRRHRHQRLRRGQLDG